MRSARAVEGASPYESRSKCIPVCRGRRLVNSNMVNSVERTWYTHLEAADEATEEFSIGSVVLGDNVVPEANQKCLAVR